MSPAPFSDEGREWEPLAISSNAPPPRANIDPDQQLGWIRRLRPLLAARRRAIAIAAGAGVIALALQVAAPALVRAGVDAADRGDRSALTTWVILLIVVAGGRLLTGSFYRYRLMQNAWDVETDLRALIYQHLTRLSFSYYDRTQSGHVISRANSDIRSIQLLLAFGPLVLLSSLAFVFAFAFMLTIHLTLTLVALATLPGVFVLGSRLRDQAFPLTWVGQARMAEMATVVDESVNGIRVVQSFAQEQRQVESLAVSAQHIRWTNVETVRTRARYNPAIEALPRLGTALVLLYGGWLAIDGEVSIGTLFAFNAYVIMFAGPVPDDGLSAAADATRPGRSAQRIYEVLDTPVEIADRPGARDLIDPAGTIDFRDVTFTYPAAQPGGDRPAVLSGLDLSVAAGETIAIVGATGSGKSTIARLLARFYDVDHGSISIDGTDIRDLTLGSLRHHVGLMFDEPFLFSTSLAENIAFGRPDASSADIERAAIAAQAHEFISELPDGYDTVVGERGYTLSGGQRQRVAIARTLLENPPDPGPR